MSAAKRSLVLFLLGTTIVWILLLSLSLSIPVVAQDKSVVVDTSAPWVTLLCKVADISDEPHTFDYYEGIFAENYPGLIAYWREVSGNDSLARGSKIFGWYTLPRAQSEYTNTHQIVEDCIHRADQDVHYPDYFAINVFFNDPRWYGAGAGSFLQELDGVKRYWAYTAIPPVASYAPAIVAHEMGHIYQMAHTLVNNEQYRSSWGIMGDTLAVCQYSTGNENGCIPMHPIAYNKKLAGWIPGEKIFQFNIATPTTIDLTSVAHSSTQGFMMVEIPLDDAGLEYYTLEARRRVGYDRNIPAEGVILHRVNRTTGFIGAELVSGNDTPPYIEQALWIPGESHRDFENNVSICVNHATETGFTITVSPAVNAGCESAAQFSSAGSSNQVQQTDTGQLITYSLRLTNTGSLAESTSISVTIPDGTAYVQNSAYTSSGTVTFADGALIFTVDDVAFGTSLDTSFSTTVSGTDDTKPLFVGLVWLIKWTNGTHTIETPLILNASEIYLPEVLNRY